MERSSPLAAVRPSTIPGPWQRFDQTDCNRSFLSPYSYSSNPNSFRSRSKPSSDYFSCKPVRESSPTSTLAIDLSQNFHIDQTPKLPTPRRSLFTTNLLRANRSNVSLTPPEPSSSPGQDEHMMDVSPLPHKPPRSSFLDINCSPTPEATPSVEEPLVRPPGAARAQSDPDPLELAPQRKALAPVRPFLRKGFSSANIPMRPKSAQNTSFQFGPPLASQSKMSLESFAESPPSERKPAPLDESLPPPFPSASLFGSSLAFIRNGSPLNNPRKAPAITGPGQRGRYRRTQSMQCNNVPRVARQEKRFCASGSFSIPPPICLEDDYKLKLPHFKNADDPEGLPRITKETFVDVLGGVYESELGEYAVVDCRFEYEYQGGHIDGAVNYNDKEELAKQLFGDKLMSQKAIIFHCEYSAHRAPIMAKFIRQHDRSVNQDNYPKLTYPEVYILDGGYSAFFTAYSARCVPQNYVEMSSVDHETACELGMAKVKRRAKLSRAQTYAFGQSSTLQTQATTITTMASDFEKISLPPIPKGMPSLTTFSSNAESMDLDFSSPFRMPANTEGYNKRHGLILGPARRMDSY